MSICPCPQCKQPLQIPQPAPAKVERPQCKSALRLSAPAAAPSKAAATPSHPALPPKTFNPFALSASDQTSAAPRRRRRSHAGIVLGAGLLFLMAGGLLAFFFL